MIVAIHQPNYIPWSGFFNKMANSDIFVLLDNVKHSKSSVTHRNKIKSNDNELMLSIPLKNKESLINELLIHDPSTSLKKHWNSIESNYVKSANWNFFSDELKNIYEIKWEQLVDLNISLIQLIKSKLRISCDIVIASELGHIEGEGSLRNLNICKKLNASIYLSGEGARSYNDEISFLDNQIQIKYNQFEHPIYPQLGKTFILNLSTIDILFNCGTNAYKYF